MGSQVRFNNIHQSALNSSNENILYISDYSNDRIRRCDARNRSATIVTTYMSSGINAPKGLIFSADMQYLYYSSFITNHLFKIQVNSATVVGTYGSGKSAHGNDMITILIIYLRFIWLD